MKVYFRRSGGFAAMFIGFQMDTTQEPGKEADELKALVNSSGIMRMSDARMAQARDVYIYTWKITEDAKEHTVTLDQLSIPEEVKPLLEFCLSISKNMMPD